VFEPGHAYRIDPLPGWVWVTPVFHDVVTTPRQPVAKESAALREAGWEGAVIVMGMLRPRRIRRRLRCMKKGHDWYSAPLGAYERCYRCGTYR